jgi:acetyltransferase-like isoleucine patch superfamily enzyme
MKVVLVARAGPIAPFGVAVDDCPVGDTTFGADRAASLVRLGLTPPATKTAPDTVITGPALVIGDDTWITRRAVAAFVRAARATTSTSTLALPPSRLTELFAPLQDTEAGFPCAFVPAGTSTTAAEAFAAPPLTIAYREIPVALPVPRYLLGKDAPTMVWPLTSTVALRVRHWLHVLRASHLAPQVWLLERALRDPLRSALRLAMGLRPSAAARQAAWRRQFRFVGRGSMVHPSAVVEGSVIGAGVTIGPHAVVLQSVVGDGCVIEQRAHLSQCTLGPRTFVSLNSSLSACVTFGDTDACANNLQACVIGPRVGLTSFARALDTVVGGSVRVDDDGALRAAGELPCGVAFGPDSYVGAGVTVAAGRVVPPGVRLVGPAGSVVKHLAGAAPGTYAVVDGSLVAARAPAS